MSDQEGLTPEEMTMEELEATLRGEELPEAVSEAAPNEEQTQGQPEEEVVAEAAPEAEQAQEEVAVEAAQAEALPEKYQNKSAEELVKILQDQESYIGKLGNERTTTKREMDELRERVNNMQVAPQSQDPQGDLRQGLEQDPAEAILKYVDDKVNSIENRATRAAQDAQEQEFDNYYNEQIASNPDFLRRRENLDVVADAIKDYIKPSKLKSRGFIEIVDLLSQATDREYYMNQALSAQRQTKETALDEKRQAKTESSYSQGSSSKPAKGMDEMSMEELEQALKKSLTEN